MTREIKFRWWNNETKDMVYGIKLGVWQGTDKDMMQYTGLKDKNGKEIYEGDIVKVNAEGSEWNMEVEIPDFYQMNYEDFYYEENCEIIGNIYENPEFLNTH